MVEAATLVFWLWCGTALATEVEVQIVLTSPRPVVAWGEPLKVHIELETVGSRYWVFYPRFLPYSVGGGLVVPRNVLTFVILDPNGRPVQRIEDEGIVDKLMHAGPCDFFAMGPANSFGFTVSLTEGKWKHDFPGRGRYKIQARFATDSRSWLKSRIEAGRIDSKDLLFDLSHVLEGTLESNTIDVAFQ
jgi:hypothetical protein